MSKKPGLMPGTLVYTAEKRQDKVTIEFYQYDANSYSSKIYADAYHLKENLAQGKVNWININGLHDTSIIESIGIQFGIHPLVLEDILHTDHMPKIEDFGDYLFMTLKMLRMVDGAIDQEHVSMILGRNYLLTFQEKDGDVFESIRENIRSDKGLIRKRGCDYLFYRLADTIVDNYYLILDHLDENIDLVEESLLANQTTGISQTMLTCKKDLMQMKRCVLPLREELRKIKLKNIGLIEEATYNYFDDVLDHLNYLAQGLDSQREGITSLMELHMAVTSNRMNNVMKTLTIFATIFMPLTFIAGIYGMNFRFMPELEWRYGYAFALGLMSLVALGLIWYIRRKRWM